MSTTPKDVNLVKAIADIPIYISKEDILAHYQLKLTDEQEKYSDKYLIIANDRINLLSGNKINNVGYDNLPVKSRVNVRLAVGRYFIWLVQQGQEWFQGSVSFSTDGLSVSQSAAAEPDYILKTIYDFLQAVNLYTPSSIFKQQNLDAQEDDKNFQAQWYNEANRYDSCDYGISWRQANREYVRVKNFSLNGVPITREYKDNGDAELNIVLDIPTPTPPTPQSILNTLDNTQFELNSETIPKVKVKENLIVSPTSMLSNSDADDFVIKSNNKYALKHKHVRADNVYELETPWQGISLGTTTDAILLKNLINASLLKSTEPQLTTPRELQTFLANERESVSFKIKFSDNTTKNYYYSNAPRNFITISDEQQELTFNYQVMLGRHIGTEDWKAIMIWTPQNIIPSTNYGNFEFTQIDIDTNTTIVNLYFKLTRSF